MDVVVFCYDVVIDGDELWYVDEFYVVDVDVIDVVNVVIDDGLRWRLGWLEYDEFLDDVVDVVNVIVDDVIIRWWWWLGWF